MAAFRDVDIELQRYLESEGTGPSRQPATAILRHDIGDRVSKKLKTITADEFDDDPGSPSSHGKQKASKRNTLEMDERVMYGWWEAVAADPLQAAGLPDLPQSARPPSPTPKRKPAKKRKYVTRQRSFDTPLTDPTLFRRSRISGKTKVPPIRPRGLGDVMHSNITTLRNMRKLNYNIAAIQAGGDPIPFATGHRPLAIRKGPVPLEGGKEVAKARMSSIGTTVLEHAGFEGQLLSGTLLCRSLAGHRLFSGASKGALDVLTDVAADFMMNLGRTLRYYSDKYAQTMTPEVRLPYHGSFLATD